jgi:hypothetical protein
VVSTCRAAEVLVAFQIERRCAHPATPSGSLGWEGGRAVRSGAAAEGATPLRSPLHERGHHTLPPMRVDPSGIRSPGTRSLWEHGPLDSHIVRCPRGRRRGPGRGDRRRASPRGRAWLSRESGEAAVCAPRSNNPEKSTRRDQQSSPSTGSGQAEADRSRLGFCLLLRSLWRLLSIEKGRPSRQSECAPGGRYGALKKRFGRPCGRPNRDDGTPIELFVAGVRLWGPRERLAVIGADEPSAFQLAPGSGPS